jgi:hypothetical protein
LKRKNDIDIMKVEKRKGEKTIMLKSIETVRERERERVNI